MSGNFCRSCGVFFVESVISVCFVGMTFEGEFQEPNVQR